MTFKILPPAYNETKERHQTTAVTTDSLVIPSTIRRTNTTGPDGRLYSLLQFESFLLKLMYFIFGFTLALVIVSFFPIHKIYITHTSQTFELYDSDTNNCNHLLADKLQLTPEQIHTSLGKASKKEIVFQWSTIHPVEQTNLYIRPAENSNLLGIDDRIIEGIRYSFTDDEKTPSGTRNRTFYHYYAVVDNLSEAKYKYYIESAVVPNTKCDKLRFYSSNVYLFSNPWYYESNERESDKPLRVAILGDLGLVNGQSTPRLIDDVDKDKYHMIIHNGDFGYDLNEHLGTLGDQFMRSIEPIAARVPYQTSVGNHEIYHNFTHYSNRFLMTNTKTGARNSFYYSFNLGPVHFVAYSTEFYYFLSYLGDRLMVEQYQWLFEDLRKANTASERKKRPWIVAFGHRPMYCSTKVGDDCGKPFNILRNGLPILGTYNLEKLFYSQGVDLVVEAHEHAYERFLPIYANQVKPGTDDPNDPYLNAKAPVHLITGSAGCRERIDVFNTTPAVGSVVQIADYGYTRLTATVNELKLEQVSDDLDGHIVDKFTIKKYLVI